MIRVLTSERGGGNIQPALLPENPVVSGTLTTEK
jgi:hypothetical protein